MTNAERIRTMKDEALADYANKVLSNYACPPDREYGAKKCNDMNVDCDKCWLDWLRQEAEK